MINFFSKMSELCKWEHITGRIIVDLILPAGTYTCRRDCGLSKRKDVANVCLVLSLFLIVILCVIVSFGAKQKHVLCLFIMLFCCNCWWTDDLEHSRIERRVVEINTTKIFPPLLTIR